MQKAEKSQTPRELSLEERIKRIINSPVLKLDGDAYKNGDKYRLNDWKSIKKFILKKLRLNNEGKNFVYTNLDTEDKIIISSNSAGKLAGYSGDVYQKTIVHIPIIIENMKFLKEMPASKENSKYGNYSYFVTGVNMDNKPYMILSVVGRDEQGVYYYHNVFEGIIRETFKNAKNAGIFDKKCGRLAEILRDVDLKMFK